MFRQLDREGILRLLKDLDRRDRKRKVFGSNLHQYTLRPPLPGSVIESFERRHGIALPADYRDFLTEIGDGGAGPYYGVLPFGQDDDGPWEEGRLVGDFSKPYPHVAAWNLPDSFWDNEPNFPPDTPIEEEDRLMEAWDKEMEENYWAPSLVDGAIPICHRGCALRQWLVIHGEQKGYVWADDRVDHVGLYPVTDEAGRPMTFSDWYMSWLYEALRNVGSGLPLGRLLESLGFARHLQNLIKRFHSGEHSLSR